MTSVSVFPTLTSQPLLITASAFFSFATPAITVPYPSAYLQTQIPFVFTQIATFASTRIPTTIGGAAATSGISTQDYASTAYGQQAEGAGGGGGGGGGGWPVWATAVIASCGGVAVIVLLAGLWCWCTRGKRRARRRARNLIKESNGGKRKMKKGGKQPIITEKHRGGGNSRRPSSKNPQHQRNNNLPPGEEVPPVASPPPLPLLPAAAIGTRNSTLRSGGKPPSTQYPPRSNSPYRGVDPNTTPPQNYNSRWGPNSELDESELDAPGYASDALMDSPARLWNPARQQQDSPRSSLNVDRGRMEDDGFLPVDQSARRPMSLPPYTSEFAAMPTSGRRSMSHERTGMYDDAGGGRTRQQLEREFRERSRSRIREDEDSAPAPPPGGRERGYLVFDDQVDGYGDESR